MGLLERAKEEFASKGVKILNVDKITRRTRIDFECARCGQPYHTTWEYYTLGKNDKLLCKKCQFLYGPVGTRIRELVEKEGLTLLEVESGKHPSFKYNCPECGKEIKLLLENAEKRTDFGCENCRENSRVPTQQEIEKAFNERGAICKTQYVNQDTQLHFDCTNCGEDTWIDWRHFRRGDNKSMLCQNCQPNKKTPIIYIKGLFEMRGAQLLSKEYINDKTPLEFLCSNCGKPWKICWDNFYHGKQNPDLLCDKCYSGKQKSPDSQSEGQRSRLDNYWLTFIMEFFNIPKERREDYSAHHIELYSLNSELRTSLVNGYPLIKSEHSGNSRFYHNTPQGRNIKSWPDVARLEHHNYPNFTFLDLNERLVTELFYPTENMQPSELLKKKREYHNKGQLYIPLFITEMLTRQQRELVYSMLRNRLYKWYPQIYEYTGEFLKRYNTRKLEIKEVSAKEARPFLEENHIQGFTGATHYIALMAGDLPVSMMTFGPPRSKSLSDDGIEWELIRFANLRNSSVPGAASKLFKYFVKTYNPKSIVSFCDIRFSSLDHRETLYPKLGFDYISQSKPNYQYRDPEFNMVYSRMVFQKKNLEGRIATYNPDLSETQNMELAGYVKQYDCGNFKYVWSKES